MLEEWPQKGRRRKGAKGRERAKKKKKKGKEKKERCSRNKAVSISRGAKEGRQSFKPIICARGQITADGVGRGSELRG